MDEAQELMESGFVSDLVARILETEELLLDKDPRLHTVTASRLKADSAALITLSEYRLEDAVFGLVAELKQRLQVMPPVSLAVTSTKDRSIICSIFVLLQQCVLRHATRHSKASPQKLPSILLASMMNCISFVFERCESILQESAGRLVQQLSVSHFDVVFKHLSTLFCRCQQEPVEENTIRGLQFLGHLNLNRIRLSRVVLVCGEAMASFNKDVVCALAPPLFRAIFSWMMRMPQELLEMYTEQGAQIGSHGEFGAEAQLGTTETKDGKRARSAGVLGIPRAEQLFNSLYYWVRRNTGSRKRVALTPLMAVLLLLCPAALARAADETRGLAVSLRNAGLTGRTNSDLVSFRDRLVKGLRQRGLSLDVSVCAYSLLFKLCTGMLRASMVVGGANTESSLATQTTSVNQLMGGSSGYQLPLVLRSKPQYLLLPNALRSMLLSVELAMNERLFTPGRPYNCDPSLLGVLRLGRPRPLHASIGSSSLMVDYLFSMLFLNPKNARTYLIPQCLSSSAPLRFMLVLLEVLLALAKEQPDAFQFSGNQWGRLLADPLHERFRSLCSSPTRVFADPSADTTSPSASRGVWSYISFAGGSGTGLSSDDFGCGSSGNTATSGNTISPGDIDMDLTDNDLSERILLLLLRLYRYAPSLLLSIGQSEAPSSRMVVDSLNIDRVKRIFALLGTCMGRACEEVRIAALRTVRELHAPDNIGHWFSSHHLLGYWVGSSRVYQKLGDMLLRTRSGSMSLHLIDCITQSFKCSSHFLESRSAPPTVDGASSRGSRHPRSLGRVQVADERLVMEANYVIQWWDTVRRLQTALLVQFCHPDAAIVTEAALCFEPLCNLLEFARVVIESSGYSLFLQPDEAPQSPQSRDGCVKPQQAIPWEEETDDQMYREIAASAMDMSHETTRHRLFWLLCHTTKPTSAMCRAWVVVRERWGCLFSTLSDLQSKTLSASPDMEYWCHMTAFLCSLGAAASQSYSFLANAAGQPKPPRPSTRTTINQDGEDDSVDVVPSIRFSHFVGRLLALLSTETQPIRAAVERSLSIYLWPVAWPTLFLHMMAVVSQCDNQIATPQPDRLIPVCCIINIACAVLNHPHRTAPQPEEVDLALVEWEDFVLLFVRFLVQLPRGSTPRVLRLKIQLCKLVMLLMQHRQQLAFGREDSFRNQLLLQIMEWTSDFALAGRAATLLSSNGDGVAAMGITTASDMVPPSGRSQLRSRLHPGYITSAAARSVGLHRATRHLRASARAAATLLPDRSGGSATTSAAAQDAFLMYASSVNTMIARLDLACVRAMAVLLDGLQLQPAELTLVSGISRVRHHSRGDSAVSPLSSSNDRVGSAATSAPTSDLTGAQPMYSHVTDTGERRREWDMQSQSLLFLTFLAFFSRVLARCFLFSLSQRRPTQGRLPASEKSLVLHHGLRQFTLRALSNMLCSNFDVGFGHMVRASLFGHCVEFSAEGFLLSPTLYHPPSRLEQQTTSSRVLDAFACGFACEPLTAAGLQLVDCAALVATRIAALQVLADSLQQRVLFRSLGRSPAGTSVADDLSYLPISHMLLLSRGHMIVLSAVYDVASGEAAPLGVETSALNLRNGHLPRLKLSQQERTQVATALLAIFDCYRPPADSNNNSDRSLSDREEVAPVAARRGLQLVCHMLSLEVQYTKEKDLLLRRNSLATSFLKLYIQQPHTGGNLLRRVLQPPLDSLVEGLRTRRLDSTVFSLGTELHARKLPTLISVFSSFLTPILQSSELFPHQVRLLAAQLRKVALTRFPPPPQARGTKSGSVSSSVVLSALLFLRFFCPAIASPSAFGLSIPPPSVVPVTSLRRALVAVASALQHLANGKLYHKPSLVPLNPWLTDRFADVQAFCEEIANVPLPTDATGWRAASVERLPAVLLTDHPSPGTIEDGDVRFEAKSDSPVVSGAASATTAAVSAEELDRVARAENILHFFLFRHKDRVAAALQQRIDQAAAAAGIVGPIAASAVASSPSPTHGIRQTRSIFSPRYSPTPSFFSSNTPTGLPTTALQTLPETSSASPSMVGAVPPTTKSDGPTALDCFHKTLAALGRPRGTLAVLSEPNNNHSVPAETPSGSTPSAARSSSIETPGNTSFSTYMARSARVYSSLDDSPLQRLRSLNIIFIDGESLAGRAVVYVVPRRVPPQTDLRLLTYLVCYTVQPILHAPYELIVDCTLCPNDAAVLAASWLTNLASLLPPRALPNLLRLHALHPTPAVAKLLHTLPVGHRLLSLGVLHVLSSVADLARAVPEPTLSHTTSGVETDARMSWRDVVLDGETAPVVLSLGAQYLHITHCNIRVPGQSSVSCTDHLPLTHILGVSSSVASDMFSQFVPRRVGNSLTWRRTRRDHRFYIRYCYPHAEPRTLLMSCPSQVAVVSALRNAVLRAGQAAWLERGGSAHASPLRVFQLSEVPAAMLHMALLNLMSLEQPARTASYSMLLQLCDTFQIQLHRTSPTTFPIPNLRESHRSFSSPADTPPVSSNGAPSSDPASMPTAGAAPPREVTRLVLEVNAKLAAAKPQLSLQFLQQCLDTLTGASLAEEDNVEVDAGFQRGADMEDADGLSALSLRMKYACTQLMTAWLPQLGRIYRGEVTQCDVALGGQDGEQDPSIARVNPSGQAGSQIQSESSEELPTLPTQDAQLNIGRDGDDGSTSTPQHSPFVSSVNPNADGNSTGGQQSVVKAMIRGMVHATMVDTEMSTLLLTHAWPILARDPDIACIAMSLCMSQCVAAERARLPLLLSLPSELAHQSVPGQPAGSAAHDPSSLRSWRHRHCNCSTSTKIAPSSSSHSGSASANFPQRRRKSALCRDTLPSPVGSAGPAVSEQLGGGKHSGAAACGDALLEAERAFSQICPGASRHSLSACLFPCANFSQSPSKPPPHAIAAVARALGIPCGSNDDKRDSAQRAMATAAAIAAASTSTSVVQDIICVLAAQQARLVCRLLWSEFMSALKATGAFIYPQHPHRGHDSESSSRCRQAGTRPTTAVVAALQRDDDRCAWVLADDEIVADVDCIYYSLLAWADVTALFRSLLALSFGAAATSLVCFHLPQLLHIIVTLVGAAPCPLRAALHSLTLNVLHTLASGSLGIGFFLADNPDLAACGGANPFGGVGCGPLHDEVFSVADVRSIFLHADTSRLRVFLQRFNSVSIRTAFITHLNPLEFAAPVSADNGSTRPQGGDDSIAARVVEVAELLLEMLMSFPPRVSHPWLQSWLHWATSSATDLPAAVTRAVRHKHRLCSLRQQRMRLSCYRAFAFICLGLLTAQQQHTTAQQLQSQMQQDLLRFPLMPSALRHAANQSSLHALAPLDPQLLVQLLRSLCEALRSAEDPSCSPEVAGILLCCSAVLPWLPRDAPTLHLFWPCVGLLLLSRGVMFGATATLMNAVVRTMDAHAMFAPSPSNWDRISPLSLPPRAVGSSCDTHQPRAGSAGVIEERGQKVCRSGAAIASSAALPTVAVHAVSEGGVAGDRIGTTDENSVEGTTRVAAAAASAEYGMEHVLLAELTASPVLLRCMQVLEQPSLWGLSFRTHFSFALSAAALKGLTVHHTRPYALDLLSTLLQLSESSSPGSPPISLPDIHSPTPPTLARCSTAGFYTVVLPVTIYEPQSSPTPLPSPASAKRVTMAHLHACTNSTSSAHLPRLSYLAALLHRTASSPHILPALGNTAKTDTDGVESAASSTPDLSLQVSLIQELVHDRPTGVLFFTLLFAFLRGSYARWSADRESEVTSVEQASGSMSPQGGGGAESLLHPGSTLARSLDPDGVLPAAFSQYDPGQCAPNSIQQLNSRTLGSASADISPSGEGPMTQSRARCDTSDLWDSTDSLFDESSTVEYGSRETGGNDLQNNAWQYVDSPRGSTPNTLPLDLQPQPVQTLGRETEMNAREQLAVCMLLNAAVRVIPHCFMPVHGLLFPSLQKTFNESKSERVVSTVLDTMHAVIASTALLRENEHPSSALEASDGAALSAAQRHSSAAQPLAEGLTQAQSHGGFAYLHALGFPGLLDAGTFRRLEHANEQCCVDQICEMLETIVASQESILSET